MFVSLACFVAVTNAARESLIDPAYLKYYRHEEYSQVSCPVQRDVRRCRIERILQRNIIYEG